MTGKQASPLQYLERGFDEHGVLLKADPELYRIVEQGLRSSEGARWVEAAQALSQGSSGWQGFFLEKVPGEPRALCWIIAAARYERWTCGSDPAPWIRLAFGKIPAIATLLAGLHETPDPWIQQMAEVGQRVLDGRDPWIGEGWPGPTSFP